MLQCPSALELTTRVQTCLEVAPCNISFDSAGNSAVGSDNFIPMTMDVTPFSELGIGVFDVAWEWRYRTAESYNDFGPPNFYPDYHHLRCTYHRIFITCGPTLALDHLAGPYTLAQHAAAHL